MMPVKSLPAPSWETTFGLGFFSAVFDNIPLTALAMKQDNYDWALLAYAVGFGGSMIWFGSSAGVAVAGLMPSTVFGPLDPRGMARSRCLCRRILLHARAARLGYESI